MKTKAYVINLTFGIWENQFWFSGADDPETEEKWEEAKSKIADIAKESTTAGIFSEKVTECFENNGFKRIQK